MSDSTPKSSIEVLSGALSDLVAGAARSVVAIRSQRARSSGFVWRPGLVVTAEEVLADEGEIAVTLPGGQNVGATLVGRDAGTDLALLRIDRADLQPAKSQTAPAKAGGLAIALGSQDGAPIASLGLVSFAGAGWRSIRGGEIDARIELELALRPHAEGGLALDASGGVFGMVVFGPRRRILVIPAATIERVATMLETHGSVPRGYIGFGLQPVKVPPDGFGIMVMSVDPEGPGAKADVRQGDVIVAWNGRTIRRGRSLLRALGPESVGSSIILSLRRAGAPVEATLVVGERPQA